MLVYMWIYLLWILIFYSCYGYGIRKNLSKHLAFSLWITRHEDYWLSTDFQWCLVAYATLTHWGRDEMNNISQTTFSNVFSSMKMFEFRLKFHWKSPINNIPALVQIMAWCRSGDEPFSEPMMVSLQTHICITRPQWVIQSDWSNITIPINTDFWIKLNTKEHTFMKSEWKFSYS